MKPIRNKFVLLAIVSSLAVSVERK
jgi:hypothetical protein